MIKKIVILSIISLLTTVFSYAQEFRAKVSVRHQQITGVDKKVFESLEKSLTDLINNRKWTDDTYKNNEKYDVSFLLNLNKGSGNTFSGILTVQANRPVFNTDYATPIVNFIDRQVTFKYEQSQVVEFDESRITGSDPIASNLTAIFAYYVNIILGFEYDSYSLRGGTNYFKKAQNIVLNAPDVKGVEGWKATGDGNKNRYYIVDQILNPRYEGLRDYFYKYHRLGLDIMSDKPNDAKLEIFAGIETLSKIHKENPGSILFQFFFNAKSAEFINLLKSVPKNDRNNYPDLLSQMDISNAVKYNAIN